MVPERINFYPEKVQFDWWWWLELHCFFSSSSQSSVSEDAERGWGKGGKMWSQPLCCLLFWGFFLEVPLLPLMWHIISGGVSEEEGEEEERSRKYGWQEILCHPDITDFRGSATILYCTSELNGHFCPEHNRMWLQRTDEGGEWVLTLMLCTRRRHTHTDEWTWCSILAMAILYLRQQVWLKAFSPFIQHEGKKFSWWISEMQTRNLDHRWFVCHALWKMFPNDTLEVQATHRKDKQHT